MISSRNLVSKSLQTARTANFPTLIDERNKDFTGSWTNDEDFLGFIKPNNQLHQPNKNHIKKKIHKPLSIDLKSSKPAVILNSEASYNIKQFVTKNPLNLCSPRDSDSLKGIPTRKHSKSQLPAGYDDYKLFSRKNSFIKTNRSRLEDKCKENTSNPPKTAHEEFDLINKATEAHKSNNFHPKLKPKQFNTYTNSSQSNKSKNRLYSEEAKAEKNHSRNPSIGSYLITRLNSPTEASEVFVVSPRKKHDDIDPSNLQHLPLNRVNIKAQNSHLKSFNNMNLIFTRKNYLGLSMLTNTPSNVVINSTTTAKAKLIKHVIKKDNFYDEEEHDEEGVKMFRDYLDDLVHSTKNLPRVFRKEKQIVLQSENYERSPVTLSTKSDYNLSKNKVVTIPNSSNRDC